MVRISWELIRKKTEHHDGLLADLEEITLHQLNIEKLEVIGRACPRLKILYLQNNLIPRIENIKRLKSLVYLNLALNNLTDISEEIAHCEKLRKLDLTVNFIDVDTLASSIEALTPLVHLDELYLTGNPCTTFPGYRAYVVHRLPKLEKLDGVDVTRGERIQAKSAFLAISLELSKAAEEKRKEKGIKAEEAAAAAAAEKEKRQSGKDDDDEAEEKEAREAGAASASSSSASSSAPDFAAKSSKVSAYTPESRLEMHRESEALEAAKAAQKKKDAQGNKAEDPWNQAQTKLNAKVILDGTETEIPRQRNMGKWDFLVSESKDGRAIIVDIEVQRFLDTSLIDVDVHPTWFQVIIKGKNLLLHFPAEVAPSETKVQRIQATGHLLLTCPKVLKTTAITTATAGTAQRKKDALDGADDDEEGDAAADAEMDRALAASESASTSKSSLHSNVIDLTSTAASRSAAAASAASSSSSSGPSAFTSHNSSGSLNQVVADYRHITKKKSAAASAAAAPPEIKELTATRSATLEEAQRERARAAQQEKQRSVEAQRASLEKLGLDDSGVPDLE